MSGDIVSVDEENVSETGGIETKKKNKSEKCCALAQHFFVVFMVEPRLVKKQLFTRKKDLE